MKIQNFLMIGALGLAAFTSCDNDDDAGDKNSLDGTVDLYATSHTNGNVTKYNLINGTTTTYVTAENDAEGIYYAADDDSFTQASRSATVPTALRTYTSVSDIITGSASVTAAFSSTSDLKSPRDLAVNGNVYVVADNADADGDDATADGRFFIYTRSNGAFTLRNVVTTDFKVWGIEFIGNDLYAVVDTTNKLAVFTNFVAANTATATVSASKTITVAGITRTHGLDYDGSTMIMTDIAAAMGAGSDTDGGFHVITDFTNKFNALPADGTLAVAQQIRFAGASTLLGNPVSVSYDAKTDTAYLAELANGGGRVVAFQSVSASTGGDVAPVVNNPLAGVSSLYLYTK